MTTKKIDYQGLSSELDDIVLALQQDELDVDEAMKKYERGLVLVKELETYLKSAENTITKLQAQHKADV
jgi:exodeoxyribonuclease VII small subunit